MLYSCPLILYVISIWLLNRLSPETPTNELLMLSAVYHWISIHQNMYSSWWLASKNWENSLTWCMMAIAVQRQLIVYSILYILSSCMESFFCCEEKILIIISGIGDEWASTNQMGKSALLQYYNSWKQALCFFETSILFSLFCVPPGSLSCVWLSCYCLPFDFVYSSCGCGNSLYRQWARLSHEGSLWWLDEDEGNKGQHTGNTKQIFL